jgi:hypothetical protein
MTSDRSRADPRIPAEIPPTKIGVVGRKAALRPTYFHWRTGLWRYYPDCRVMVQNQIADSPKGTIIMVHTNQIIVCHVIVCCKRKVAVFPRRHQKCAGMSSGFMAQVSSYLPSIKTFSTAVKKVTIPRLYHRSSSSSLLPETGLSFRIMPDSMAIFLNSLNASRT